jgi:hypothetical protein
MRIRVVLARQNAGWVIGKMAHRLCDALARLGHEASVSDVPDPSADVNHWMSFAFAEGVEGSINTMFITHPDDPFKIRLITESLKSRIHLGVCMSRYTVREMEGFGVDERRVWYVLPAVDAPIAPRRLRIGVTTRVYDDGRKREALLVRLASEMRLENFHFQIFGSGWESVVQRLREAGALVDHDPGTDDWQNDYVRIRAAVPDFDYYLYLGMDEGSLGTLDAVSAGIETMISAQGFHLELPGGIDHPFVEYDTLRALFARLSSKVEAARGRLASWTWEAYAREHAALWELLIRHHPDPVPRSEMERLVRPGSSAPSAEHVRPHSRLAFYVRALSPVRLRGAVARWRWLRPLRRRFGF